MSEIKGPMLMFAFALAVTIAAALVDNRCEPFFRMVGGCR